MRFSQKSTASIRAANGGFRHTAYTIALKPSRRGKVTATSSDGHTFTAAEPLFTGARYWQAQGAPSSATILTVWSNGPGHWALRFVIYLMDRPALLSKGGKAYPRLR